MKNQQKPEPRLLSEGNAIFWHSIFHTIQGEGPHAGRPAVFLRLSGCNLQCPACDTEYTSSRNHEQVFDLVDRVEALALATGTRLIVITGGEPFRQNISKLCDEMICRRLQVQIETNGMLAPQGFSSGRLYHGLNNGSLMVVISPKTHKLDPLLGEYAAAFKYVLRAGQVDDDGLPTQALDHPLPAGQVIARPPPQWRGPIYVQPADIDEESNPKHLRAAVEAVMFLTNSDPRRDYRLCLQIHKYAGLD